MSSGAQGCRFFVLVQFRPADALLGSEPGGDQGTLFARNVAIYLLCVVFVLLYFFD